MRVTANLHRNWLCSRKGSARVGFFRKSKICAYVSVYHLPLKRVALPVKVYTF